MKEDENTHREGDHLITIKEKNILNILPDQELDKLTRLASLICRVPFAFISVMDGESLSVKSKTGIEVMEMPRHASFYYHTVKNKGLYQVTDASRHKLFAHHKLVTGYPHIRFYAGVSLIDRHGNTLGTLCVADTVAKEMSAEEKEMLVLLSEQVVRLLDLRQKQAEEEKSKKLFHEMVEEVADIIYTSSPEGDFTFVNQKVEPMLGYKAAELIGKNFSELIVPEWKQLVIDFYSEQFSQLTPETKLEFPVLTKKGETRWVEQTVAAIVKDSRIMGFQGIVRDISDRKKYETELLETKAMLTHAMSIGRMGSFENNVVTRKIAWSKEIYDMMEMPATNLPLTYEEYLAAIHPNDLENVVNRMQATIETKNPDVNVCRFITAKGKVKWIETRVVPLFDMDGNLIIFRGTMQDITEQKELEKQLITSKELAEQSVMAKEQFLANMSHEIRTPMNAVMGFADLLAGTRLDQDQREYISAIQTSGKNLLAIINDILDYSKIEAGMMTIEETPLSIRSIFSSLTVLFGHKAKEKGLSLSFSSDATIPETVLGDSTRLTQIITNLVGNAIKFTLRGSVQVHAMLVKKDRETVEVKFSVQDTGIGIKPEKQAMVFERFNQGSNSTTRQFGGTGLGLSIVKKLVELQGGKIWLTSEEQAGSTFEFTIAFKANEDCTHVEYAKSNGATCLNAVNSIKILLAEDNPMNQKLAARILNNMGHQVEIAGNGKIAVDKVLQNQYDLVLMDMQMPEMDGYEAAQIIRKKLSQHIPIIAMTAHALHGEKEKCLEMGMNDYIAKPFKPEALREKIAALLPHDNTGPREILVNLGGIREMSGGDPRFMRDILHMFVETTTAELHNLQTAIEKGQLRVIRTVAHKLISSVGLVGLKDRLLPVLREMEELDASFSLHRLREIYSELYRVCQRAFSEVRLYL